MLPAGFERLLLEHAVAVARSDLTTSFRAALLGADGTPRTLHEFAARQNGARPLHGRGVAYAVALPHGSMRVVIRHNRRGGLMAPLLGDRFVAPTRAPRELAASAELIRRGVRTPDVLGYALYPPGGMIQRSDVCTREIGGARDLADVLTRGIADERRNALGITARLVASLSRARARHHDLNAKNILLDGTTGYVLDVDRVALDVPEQEALTANLRRLSRSLRKWRDRFRANVSENDIAVLETTARQSLRSPT
jgi:tRNA A-37 threonylcarbamoyl transferase component Bud32